MAAPCPPIPITGTSSGVGATEGSWTVLVPKPDAPDGMSASVTIVVDTPCPVPPPLSGTVTGDVFTPRTDIGTLDIGHDWTAMNCRVTCPSSNTALVVWDAAILDASMTVLFFFSGATTAPGATTSVVFDSSVMDATQRHNARFLNFQARNNSSTVITQSVTFEVLSYTGPCSAPMTGLEQWPQIGFFTIIDDLIQAYPLDPSSFTGSTYSGTFEVLFGLREEWPTFAKFGFRLIMDGDITGPWTATFGGTMTWLDCWIRRPKMAMIIG